MKILLEEMKAALIADSTLSAYLGDTVYIRKWDPEALPDFDTYGVVLSPAGPPYEEECGVKGVDKIFEIIIVCLVENFGMPGALIGQTSPAKKGLFQMVDDIKSCLRANSLNGAVLPDNTVFAEKSDVSPAIPDDAQILAAHLGYRGRRRLIIQ